MIEHEDVAVSVPSVKESSPAVDSATADEIITKELGDGEGKIEVVLDERDEREDMIVDVVGTDVVVDGRVGKLDSEGASLVKEDPEKETETRDLHTEEGGEVYGASVEIRVLTSMKSEVVVKQEGVQRSVTVSQENCDIHMEEVGRVGEEATDPLLERRDSTVEKAEVMANEEGVDKSAEVSEEVSSRDNVITPVSSELDGDGDVPKSEHEAGIGDSKSAVELSGEEPQVVKGEIDVIEREKEKERGLTEEIGERTTESVEGVIDGDRVMNDKGEEGEVLEVIKEVSQDVVKGETDVIESEKQKGLTEETVERAAESVEDVIDGDRVMNDKGEEDEVLEVIKEVSHDNVSTTVMGGSCGDVQKSGHETGVGDSKIVVGLSGGEPQVVEGEIAVIDGEKEKERGLTEEIVAAPRVSVQEVAGGDCVMDDKVEEAEVLCPSKMPDSLTATTDLGLEEVGKKEKERGLTEEIVERPIESVQEVADADCVMADNGEEDGIIDSSKMPDSLTTTADLVSEEVGKKEKERGLTDGDCVMADNREDGILDSSKMPDSLNTTADVVSAEVNEKEKERGLTDGDCVMAGNGEEDGILDSSKIPDSLTTTTDLVSEDVDEKEKERDLTADIVERPMESVQEVANEDCVMDDKGEKTEVLDSSKMPGSLSTNLFSEEVVQVVTDDGSVSKDEAPNSVSVVPSIAFTSKQSSSTEVVDAITSEGAVHVNAESLVQEAEVDVASKEELLHPTIDAIKADVSHEQNNCSVEQQVVDVKPADESLEQGGDFISSPDTTKPTGGGMEQIVDNVSLISTFEGSGEHVIGGGDGEITVASVASVAKDEDVAALLDTKVSKVVATEHLSGAGEVLTTDDNKICSTYENKADTEVEASMIEDVNVDKTANTHVAVCTEGDEVETTASKVPNPEVQVPNAGGMDVIENQELKGNAVTESSKDDESSKDQTMKTDTEIQVPNAGGMDVVIENQELKGNAVTESSRDDESSKDQTMKTDTEVQNVELSTMGDTGYSLEEQGLKAEAAGKSSEIDTAVRTVLEPTYDQILFDSANEVAEVHTEVPNSDVGVPKTGEVDVFKVSSEDFEGVNQENTHTDAEHTPPADPQFQYEADHGDRGDDQGMDIDEVLSWKDEEPGIDALSVNLSSEKDQHFKIDGNSGTNVDHGFQSGQPEEDPKFQHPIVYERRAHVEFPVHVVFDDSSSLRSRDENLKVETLHGNSEENIRLVQEEQQNKVSTDPPSVDEMEIEHPSNLAPLDAVGGEDQPLEAHINEEKDIVDNKQLEDSSQLHVESSMEKEVDVEEHSGTREDADFSKEQETKEPKHVSEAEKSAGIDEDIAEPRDEASVSLYQSCYFHPPENEGEFSVTDLVWGKIRSHPWWPGQIFDPADASEKAMKYHKKDCFLVAYFGDGTFAWNDSTVLKPFRSHFSQIEKKHSNSDAFRNAVSCALEEVSRRVELGLACSCISQDIYEKIECQVVENGGIRQESNRRHGVDKSAGSSSFEPDKLVDYVRLLAQFPYDQSDKMELVIAKAQLLSYGRYKGYQQLAEIQFCGELLEDVNDASMGEMVSEYPHKKERSLSELMDNEDGAEGSDGNITGDRKRKALDSVFVGSEKRQSLHLEKVPIVQTPTSKPSFKVGECIQRVASQLTGSPSILKCSSDKKVDHVDPQVGFVASVQTPENPQKTKMVVPGEMLSQLHLAAQDPMKGYSFLNSVIPFFSSYRSVVLSISRKQNSSTGGGARKRKPSNENDPEEFEFDDVNDSYWTDRIIQNYSEEQLLQENQNGGGEHHQVVSFEQDKPVKPSRRSNKKRFFNSNHEIEADEQSELVERRRQNLATEVVLKFAEGIYFPSELHLNKMFKRFGPLMESETEVDRQGGRARVVFKKCSDAEVAHNSAGKFNIFGSITVNYELNYTPLVSYKPLPLPMLQYPEDAT